MPVRWLPGRRSGALALCLALAACGAAEQDRPLDVSVIGGAPHIVDPSRTAIDVPEAALLGATAEGLVTFDQTGLVQPGIAERWIVYDQGRSFIFRLRPGTWPDGGTITAPEVARRLRAIANQRSRNPLRPLLGAIDEISAVTPEVIEVDLHSPRPYLLQILAQPEAAILHGSAGAGPMTAVPSPGPVIRLRPRPDPDAPPGEKPDARRDVTLRGGRAALAIVLFGRGETDAVLGGTFADLPLVRAAGLPPTALRFDPAGGLFGLAFSVVPSGFTSSPASRQALAMAIDRDAIAKAFAVPGWSPTAGLVSGTRPDLPAPSQPEWAAQTLDDRRAAARAQADAWTKSNGAAPMIRVALPEGSGGKLLFALLVRSWASIGVQAERVALGARADLSLVDRVAPSESANFYLRRFACEEEVPCTPESDAALSAARAAPTLAERSAQLAEADRLIVANAAFIALGPPVRWSLVSQAAAGWRPSARGIHPLVGLRDVDR